MKHYLYVALALIFLLQYACGTPAAHPIDYPQAASADDRIIGTWKYEEDTDKANYYEITRPDNKYGRNHQYHVRFFDRGGSFPSLEHEIFFSEVDGIKFINVPFFERSSGEGDFGGWIDKGYFYLRIIAVNKGFTRLTTATVNDPELSKLKSQLQISRYMLRNAHKAHIYSDTAHFYKILPVKGVVR